MTEQRQKPSPSTLVDQALDQCVEAAKKGFEDFEYEEESLRMLRTSLRDDFGRVLGNENGAALWEKDGPILRRSCYRAGVAARTAAQVADESTILPKHIGAALVFVHRVLSVSPGVNSYGDYCREAQNFWNNYLKSMTEPPSTA